jgi:hypothetical protein
VISRHAREREGGGEGGNRERGGGREEEGEGERERARERESERTREGERERATNREKETEKFAKVSNHVHLLYKINIQRTFENFCRKPRSCLRSSSVASSSSGL